MMMQTQDDSQGNLPLEDVNTTSSPASRRFGSRRPLRILGLCFLVFLSGRYFLAAKDGAQTKDLITQLRQIPSSTLSDAMDEVVGVRCFMDHDMRPITKGRMVGRAKTVLFGPVTTDTEQSRRGPLYAIQTIDESGPGDVLVVAVGDRNITGLGGLMATTAKARGLEGVVVDGAVRDLDQIEANELIVFACSVSPATMLKRYTSLAKDVSVMCAGVTVNPGDYIIGDRDGVVCIPARHIDAVLKRSIEMEETEAKMFPMIRAEKSLLKVIELFKRI